GWETNDEQYLANVAKCQELTQTDLFRPPYARATKSQLRQLYKKYRVIMWDIMSGDF
ncbi:MAG TPA: polysaccharide deacetylase family protein, partial [Sphingobacterium sp.]|nr:polysaccharide deacetylase family protein [Sphingobacterium sp.]